MKNSIVGFVWHNRHTVVLFCLLSLLTAGLSPSVAESDLPQWQAPTIVKNINLQTEDGAFERAVTMGGNLYFLASAQGVARDKYEIWRTDGTPGGTTLLETFINLAPGEFHVLGDKILFTAAHPDYGEELWITDGTPGNAHVIGDMFPGWTGGSQEYHTVAGDYLYFKAWDETNLTELWRTDGTLAGTIRLTGSDLPQEAYAPNSLVEFGGTLYYIDYTSDNKARLMKSTGTPAGTNIVKELGDMQYGHEVHTAGGILYVVSRDIWRSDGTAAGTYVIHSLPDDRSLLGVAEGDSTLYFALQDSHYESELWQTTGTAAATSRITIIPSPIDRMTTAGNRLFFVGSDASHGSELWTSDGTAAGTKLVKDIYPGDNGSMIFKIVPVGNQVYFGANEYLSPSMRRLWRSDGTATGTVPVPLGLPADFDPRAEAVGEFNGRVFAQIADPTHGREPWMGNTGGSGATFLVDLNEFDSLSSMPGYFNYTNDLLFFWTTHGLWRSDGTASGTSTLVNNIYMHREIRQDHDTFATVGKWLYFAIDERPNNDVELWRTDGTVAGTTLVMNAVAPMFREDPIYSMADVNGTLYFARFAHDRPRKELWRSDGTPGGTFHVATPYLPDPNNVQSSLIDEITGVGNTVYFVATNGVNGVELWRSNGTTAGTAMVKDIKPGPTGSAPSNLTAVGAHVFFFADDGIHGRELWRSDGTANGTVMVKDILPGPTSSLPAELTQFGGAGFFAAHDGIHGRELWRSDGTATGTIMVKDILPGGSSNPRQLTTSDAGLFFFASDDSSLNPYKSDGTLAGTMRMAIVSYNDFELPEKLTAVDEWVFFVKGDRLFQAGGPTIGTIAQDEAYPDFQTYQIANLTAGRGRLFFSATHVMYGNEPFVKHLVLAENTPDILYIPEGGNPTQFRLKLNVKPLTSITVRFSSTDPTLEISPSTYTFTSQNWNTPAVIGVRVAEDGKPGVRAAIITQTFESADGGTDGAVLEMPVKIGWQLGYMPVALR